MGPTSRLLFFIAYALCSIRVAGGPKGKYSVSLRLRIELEIKLTRLHVASS